MPANVCQTSGGSWCCRRLASSTIALEPAPPGTAAFIALTLGFDLRNVANSTRRAAASDPDVHQDTTSSRLVLVVALVGVSPPHPLNASAIAATTATAHQRTLTPRPRRVPRLR